MIICYPLHNQRIANGFSNALTFCPNALTVGLNVLTICLKALTTSSNTLIYVYLNEDCEMNEFDGRLIDFRTNRSQFLKDRPVFLRE